ncbi:modular serine protease-like [Cydia amplana]|uniref:modular serine protease-like n=1 Tax=Cydia amplana TaxID=1869771 RepID=UPI002FE6289E
MITALILASQNIELSKGDSYNSTHVSNVFQNATSLDQNITNIINQEHTQDTEENKEEAVTIDSNGSNLNEFENLGIIAGAAHCFWSELDGGALPAAQFAAAAGKLYRPWKESHDLDAQQADISAINLPARFRGAITSFQDDIAAVLLAKEFVTTVRVRPLCVLFDDDLEADFLRSENEGMIVGWGLTSEDGTPAQTLQSLYMPYVPIEDCIASAEPGFLKYITSDKICAGVTTGKSLCRGDSGGGLVFNSDLVFIDSEEPRPFLYGVASTAPRNAHSCNTHARATLTRVLAHRAFLRAHIPDIEDACAHGSSRIFKSGLDRTREESKRGREDTKPVFNCNCFCNCNNFTTP